MSDFLLGIAEISVSMSFVIAVILILSKVFGKRFSAKCRYIIWALVIIRLCIPLSALYLPRVINIDFPIRGEQIAEEVPYIGGNEEQNHAPINEKIDGEAEQQLSESEAVIVNEKDTAADVTPYVPQNEVIKDSEEIGAKAIGLSDIVKYAGYAYLAAAAMYFTVLAVVNRIMTLRYKSSAKMCDENTLAVYKDICAKEKINNPPRIYMSNMALSPMLCGYFKPYIIIPDCKLSETELRGILAHELTHFRRGDLWLKLACLLAQSIHIINPLVHVAAKRCNREMELSCDEYVLQGFDENSRRSYGNAMLDIIKHCRKNRAVLTTQFNPRKNAVKERILNILDMTKKRRGITIIALVALVCVVSGTVIGCNFTKENVSLSDEELMKQAEEVFFDAEKVYSYFTGYGSPYLNEKTIVVNGIERDGENYNLYDGEIYRCVADESMGKLESLEDLRAVCNRYFTEELTEKLLKTKVKENCPLYYESGGRLYRFDGYATLFGYDIGGETKLSLVSNKGGEAVISAMRNIEEFGENGVFSVEYKLKITENGILFKDFKLIAEQFNSYLNKGEESSETENETEENGNGELLGLVSDAINVDLDFKCDLYPGETYHYRLKIPKLNSDTEASLAFNDLIMSKYYTNETKERIKSYENGENGSFALEQWYDLYTYDKTIIISVRKKGGLLGTGGVIDTYDIYYYDTENDKQLSKDEFIRLYTGGKYDASFVLTWINELPEVKNCIAGERFTVTDNMFFGILPSNNGLFEAVYQPFAPEGMVSEVKTYDKWIYADSIDKIDNLLSDKNDVRLRYLRAFLSKDTKELEELCFCKEGMYESYKTLEISKWIASVENDKYGNEIISFSFSLSDSKVDGLPAKDGNGNVIFYNFNIIDGIAGVSLYNPNEKAITQTAEKALNSLIGSHIITDIPKSDEMSDALRWNLTCYICSQICKEGSKTLEEMKEYAQKCFGIEDFVPDNCHMSDGLYTDVGHGGARQYFEIVKHEYISEDRTEITVRYFADASKTIFSHSYVYAMYVNDGDWCFISSKRVNDSQYEPFKIQL